jgi:hypothetical protein
MANRTRQVQRRRRSEELVNLDRKIELALKEGIAAMEAQMAAGKWGPFYDPEGARRHYPGEAEAVCLLGTFQVLSELNSNPKKLKALLKQFRTLRQYEQACNNGNARAAARAEHAVGVLRDKLHGTVLSGRIVPVDIRKEGMVIQPTTLDGMTALALLSLSLRHKSLSRIRLCLQCASWFYARFKHQRFCNDPMKKCQWNHYHTPDWRKRHREQNRKHQGEYRKRVFGVKKAKT